MSLKFYQNWRDVNPVLPEFCFPSIFKTQPKIGSYGPPTHRRGVLVKFF